MKTNRPIQVAIIGQGRSGRGIHAHLLKQLPEQYQIVAVVDGMETRRKSAIQDFGCDAYEHHEHLYERDDVELIINATPSHLHVPLSLAFLQRGFHVLCEKPLASSVKEVDTLMAAAQTSGKLLSVFQQSRYSPAYQKMRQVIASGVLGRVVRAQFMFNGFSRRWDWQTLKQFNGGNLMNMGPHPLDQALQLFGDSLMPDVTSVLDSANSFGDAEDYGLVLLRGTDRPAVSIEISSCDAYAGVKYHIQGTNGGLKGNFTELQWKYFRAEEAPKQELITEPLFHPDGTPKSCSEQLDWYEKEWRLSNASFSDVMGLEYYRMLYRTIREHQPLEVTPEQVRIQIAVMEECFRQNPKYAR